MTEGPTIENDGNEANRLTLATSLPHSHQLGLNEIEVASTPRLTVAVEGTSTTSCTDLLT